MSFFEELKRRNVFRVGIAYAIAAWVLLQVADLVLEAIEAPAWVLQALMLVIGLGFVAAIVIAWAYELTPEGIKLEKEVDRSRSITKDTGRKLDRVIIGFMAVAIVLLLADRFMRPPAATEPVVEEQAAAIEPAAESKPDAVVILDPVLETPAKSIAVLPFANMSEDTGNEFFADGISEEILNALAKVRELKVAGRTSAFAFKDRNEDLRQIGEALGVNHILEGSVRKAGNKVRVTAQLIQVSDGFHLWSDTYDRELTDIFAIQDEIANSILQALKAELVGGQSIASERADPVVYEQYLLAKQHIYTRNQPSLESATELLREATEMDPGFASAWGQLGIATLLLADDAYGTIPQADALSVSRVYLKKALEIDENNADALAGMGLLYNNEPGGRSVADTAISYLERALAINPAMIDASNWLQQAYNAAGRGSDALRVVEEMFNRDPLYKPGAGNLVFAYNMQGRTEAAERVLERIRPFIRDQAFISRVHANVLSSSGRFGEALSLARSSFELDPNDAVAYSALAWSMYQLGMYEELMEMKAPIPFFRLFALLRLGRHEEGLQYAQTWSDRAGNPDFLITFYHTSGQAKELVKFVDARWPDLESFETEFPASDGFGHYTMIQLANAYKQAGKMDKFRQAMKYVRIAHDQQRTEGFESQFLHSSESAYWALTGDTDRALDHLEISIAKGNAFPLSEVALTPEWQPLLSEPGFRELVLKAHEQFNAQRVIAGLEPVEPDWAL